MSNSKSTEGETKSEPFIVRRAESLDSDGVSRLVKKQTEALFGRINADDVIEKASLGISLASEGNNLLAFAAFYDHPSLSNVPQSEWEKWLHTNYDCPQANPLNSLFLRLYVSQENYSQDALKEILKTSFLTAPLLQYIFLYVPSTTSNLGSALEMFFSPVANSTQKEDDLICLYVTDRYQHYPMLHVRLAKVEDNDDLLPIIQQCTTEGLTRQYGDYFIAELIESQDKDHQTVVAEVDGRAVGFISVTTEIDLNVLWENYQLEPYHGLRKPCDDDVITTKPLLETSMVLSNKSEKSISDVKDTAITEEQTSLGKASGQTSEVSTVDGEPTKKHYVLQGSSNAAVIQLFCMDEQYEMRSIDLLPAVFKLFPEIDFIVLTLPHSFPHYPLLSHFTRVSTREGSTVNQELYVLHKCSLLHSLQVKPLLDEDVDGVTELVSSLSAEQSILDDVRYYIEGKRDPLNEGATPIYAFVVHLLEQIVGIVVLRHEKDLLYLLSHYNIEDYVYFAQHNPNEHIHLHHFLINPIFAPHIKHILKEVMRLSHSNNIYYPLPLNTTRTTNHSLTLALNEMVPVRPRRQIHYPAGLDINAPLTDVTDTKPNATLYHTNRKLCLEPKIPINTHIVCVGASDTTLSFLECLVFSPHLRFNNLILVSHNGLCTTQSNIVPNSCCFYDDALSKIGLEGWVTVIPGSLNGINREDQSITIQTSTSTDTVLNYDYLVLSTGLQYDIEMPKYGHIPENGLVTLNEDNCREVMEQTRQQFKEGHIVVYGSNLISYTVIQYLLSVWNVKGEDITLVQPNDSPTKYFNETTQDILTRLLTSLGVNIVNGHIFHQYHTDGSLKNLRAIELTQDNDDIQITIPCTLMFCLQTQHVDKLSFKAINDACLVYDNRLVINPEHSTNDPRILGAGPLTKFSHYYRTPWSHEYFNSHEVGQRLASTILSKLDPTYVTDITTTSNNRTDLIPAYHQPKEVYAILPGSYYFLHIDKPRVTAKKDGGQILSTLTDNGYFELYINKYNRIETITVLSNKIFEVTNYRCLYNIHEQYLNNLLIRWSNKLIPDLFLYFREQWACAIFHDRFHDFLSEIDDILRTAATTVIIATDTHVIQEEGKSLRDEVKEILEDSSTFSVKDNEEKIAAAFASYNLSNTINGRLHRYLQYNSYHLPMYAQSDMI